MATSKGVDGKGLRVLGLVGIFDCWGIQDGLWKNIEAELREQMPGCEIDVVRKYFKPWETALIQDYAFEAVSRFDDGKPTLLLGYSLGGVVAQVMAEKFQKSEIVGVVSLCSPLKWADKWGFTWHPEALPGKRLAIMGTVDMLVPWWTAQVPNVAQRTMWIDHLAGFTFFPQVSRRVVAMIKEELGTRN